MTRFRVFSSSMLLLLVIAACGGPSAPTDTSRAGDTVPTSAGSVQTVSGALFDLGDLEGQDTVLWFWAPW